MKYLTVFMIILSCCLNSIYAQLPIEIKAGKGYFAEPIYMLQPDLGLDERLEYNPKFYGKMLNGNSTWFEIAYKLKTGYNLAFNFSNATTSQYYNDYLGFYWDSKIYRAFDYYSLSFLKNFRLGKHSISPGFGLSYRTLRESFCDYEVKFTEDDPAWEGTDGILYSYPVVYDRNIQDLGIELKFDYQYYITSYFNLGIRLSANFPFGIGLHTVLISPFFSIDLGDFKN